ncbi:MAG: F0F1 ATP synthase subunit delta [Acidocella sp.]|uniref:F0F1 ATP synthase subunit delta n=1 Tax=Acidocella sp. TaxID=50710 RepID=UPI003FBEE47C
MTIDWPTLLLQTVNVLILIWLLQKFFWRPVAGMIAQRRAATQTMLDDAAQKRDAAAAAMAEIEQTRAGFAQERQAILAAAQAEAAQHRAAGLVEAHEAVRTVEAAARDRLAAEQREAEAMWRQHASELAVDISGRLAARLNGAAVRAAFLDWLLEDIAALPEAVRRLAEGATLEVLSATALAPEEQAQCATRLAALFGAAPRLVFHADPALIAGLELRGQNILVRNSWRADLDRILKELGNGSA